MKVLFAIGRVNASKGVAEKYYNKYGEELEYKDVFYFKAHSQNGLYVINLRDNSD